MHTSPKIKGLSHITLICQDLNKTSNFLKELLGATEVYSSEEKTFSLSKEKFFNVAGLWIAIMKGDAIERTYNHIAFKIEESEISYFKEKIELLGLTLLPSRPRQKGEGESLYFYDYDNHLFELHTGTLDERLTFYHSSKISVEPSGS